MAVEPKVRPSLTQSDMQIIAEACQYKLNAHLQAGDFNNPVILQLDRLAKYCQTFVKQEESMAQMFARFMASQGQALPTVEQAIATTTTVQATDLMAKFQEFQSSNPLPQAVVEPVILTDEQRYDMLKLKPAKSYSEEDKQFFLNKGTFIEMQRKLKLNEPVNEGDL